MTGSTARAKLNIIQFQSCERNHNTLLATFSLQSNQVVDKESISGSMIKFGAFKLRKDAVLVLIGEKSRLNEQAVTSLLQLQQGCIGRLNYASKNFSKDCVTTFENDGQNHLRLAYLKTETSRNLASLRSDAIPNILKANTDEQDCQIVLLLKNLQELSAATNAIARAFPTYNRKTGEKDVAKANKTVEVSFVLPEGQDVPEAKYLEMQSLASKVALAANLTETPPTDLNTKEYAHRIKESIKDLSNVTSEVIVGDELYSKGLHTIWSVGKAAVHPSHLIILHYQPESGDAKKSIAFVGKGITYDTGGLSIKATAGMCGMKRDMGGSAAVLGAFLHLVEIKHSHPVIAALCIAENAVGERALKNDDIIRAYSGKTIEINNTDAEGRLVLADGVSYVSKHYKPSVLLDIATLTGAQLIATGKHHAAVLSPTAELEDKLLAAAKSSGDLAFPILYCPELLLPEFKSEVADMKNSDRGNAQSSCAGHFIEQHLDPDWVANGNKWAHIDMAGPSGIDNRSTGYGVALLSTFAKTCYA